MHSNRNLGTKNLSCSKQMTDNYDNYQQSSILLSAYKRWLYPIYSFSEEIMFTHQNLSWELKTKLSLQLLEVGTIRRYSFPHIISFYLLDSLFAAFCPFIRDHFRIQSDLIPFTILWTTFEIQLMSTPILTSGKGSDRQISSRPCLHRDVQENHSAFNF